MTLFPDQSQFTHELAISLSKHRKVLGQAATGFGKTIVFSNISARWVKKQGTSVLIFVHREELQTQTRKTLFNDFKIEAIPIIAGMKYIPPSEVYVGMIESTFRRLHKIHKIGLVIIDECHIDIFNKLHEEFPEVKVLGFSATPVASNKKKPLKNYYEDIVCGPQISELIALKRLSQNITYSPKEVVDRSELKMKGDDFDDEIMSLAFRKPKHITNTIEAYKARGVGLKTVIYNVNLQHSRDVCKAFNEAGYPCRHLGSDNKHERKEIMKWLKDNPHAIVSNVGIATTGTDEPTIEHIIFNKSTASMTLWVQCCGRGGRRTPTKTMFYITDMGSNWLAHGDWSQDRDWRDLFFFPEKAKKPGVPPIKSCPNCDAIVSAGLSICPYCEHVFEKKKIAPEMVAKEFVVITKNIDVKRIIETNTDKKEYFTLFEIGRQLSESMKEKEIEVNEITFNLALQHYHAIGKQWTKERGKHFNEFHRTLIRKNLIEHLQWEPPVV